MTSCGHLAILLEATWHHVMLPKEAGFHAGVGGGKPRFKKYVKMFFCSSVMAPTYFGIG